MKRLCFGTYISVLRACVPTRGTRRQTPQKKLVGIILMSVNRAYDITSDDYKTSRLASCNHPLPEDITKSAPEKLSDIGSVVAYFKQNVVPLLSSNMQKQAVLAIRDILFEDELIGEDTLIDLVGYQTKKALLSQNIVVSSTEWMNFLARFLAGVFLYTATSVDNQEGKPCVREITVNYVRSFDSKNGLIKITAPDNHDEIDGEFPSGCIEKTPSGSENGKGKQKSKLPDADKVKKILDESIDCKFRGEYMVALELAQKAIETAEAFDKSDPLFDYRIACAKRVACRICIIADRNAVLAKKYALDVITSHAFDDDSEKLFSITVDYARSCLFADKDISVAREALKKAKSLANDESDEITCREAEALIYEYEGKYTEAIEIFQESADKFKFWLETHNYSREDGDFGCLQGWSVSINNIGWMYRKQHKYIEAAPFFAQAAIIAKDPRLEIDRSHYLMNLSECYGFEGQWELAIENAIESRKLGEKHNLPSRIRTLEFLGRCYYMIQKLPESIETFRAALDASVDTKDKIHFLQIMASNAAEIGDEISMKKYLSEATTLASDMQDELKIFYIERQEKRLRKHLVDSRIPEDLRNVEGIFAIPTSSDDYAIASEFSEEMIGIDEGDTAKLFKIFQEKYERIHAKIESKKADNEECSDEDGSDEIFVPDRILKLMITRMNECTQPKEKVKRMYEIGGVYLGNKNPVEADLWFHKVLIAADGDAHLLAMAKLGHAQVLTWNNTLNDDAEALTLAIEAKNLIQYENDDETKMFCVYVQARLEARRGNFTIARSLFNQALSILDSSRIDDPYMEQRIRDYLRSVGQYLETDKPPALSFNELVAEHLTLQTWYPEFSSQLAQYWWYYVSRDVLRNFHISSQSGCVICDGDTSTVEWYSHGLRSLFGTRFYSPKNSFIKGKSDCDFFPVPEDTRFPFSVMYGVSSKPETDSSKFSVYRQSDGSKTRYAYEAFIDDNSFDAEREPKPLSMVYLQESVAPIIRQLPPTIDEFGGFGWFTGVVGYNISSLALLNYCAEMELVPVFSFLDKICDEGIVIKRQENIRVPFYAEKSDNIDLNNLHKIIRKMCGKLDSKQIHEYYDDVISQTKNLSQDADFVVHAKLLLVDFPFQVWSEGPLVERTYPILLISQNDRDHNFYVGRPVSISIAKTHADYLLSKIRKYSHKDKSFALSDFETIRAIYDMYDFEEGIVECYVDALNNICRLFPESFEENLNHIESIRNEEWHQNVEVARSLLRMYFMRLNGSDDPRIVIDTLAKAKSIYEECFGGNIGIAFDYACGIKNTLFFSKIDKGNHNDLLSDFEKVCNSEFSSQTNTMKIFYAITMLRLETDESKFSTWLRQIDRLGGIQNLVDYIKRDYILAIARCAERQEPQTALKTLSRLHNLSFSSIAPARDGAPYVFFAYVNIITHITEKKDIQDTLFAMGFFFNLAYGGDYNAFPEHIQLWYTTLGMYLQEGKVSSRFVRKQLDPIFNSGAGSESFNHFYGTILIYDGVFCDEMVPREEADIESVEAGFNLLPSTILGEQDANKKLLKNLCQAVVEQKNIEVAKRLFSFVERLISVCTDYGNSMETLDNVILRAMLLSAWYGNGKHIESFYHVVKGKSKKALEHALSALFESAGTQPSSNLDNIIERIYAFSKSEISPNNRLTALVGPAFVLFSKASALNPALHKIPPLLEDTLETADMEQYCKNFIRELVNMRREALRLLDEGEQMWNGIPILYSPNSIEQEMREVEQ